MRRPIGEVPAKASLALAVFLLCLTTGASAQVTSRALIPNQADSSVSIIDVATGVVQIVPSVGSGSPNSVAVTPDGRHTYVGVSTLGVVLLDMTSGLTTPVATANGVAAVVVTPDGGKAYFTDVATATVTPIDVATNTVGSAIAVGTSPLAVGVAPDGLHAYVLNNGANSIAVLDTATDTVVDTINLTATGPIDIVFTPDSTTAYVATPGSHSVSVIDLVNRTEVLPAIDIGVGTQASHLAITPDGSTIFTANAGTGAVSVIDTGTRRCSPPSRHLTPRPHRASPSRRTCRRPT